MNSIKLLLCLIGSLVVADTFAQTFSEFFKQKKTQRKYWAKQALLLQVYTDALKDGYKLAGTGLSIVNDFKTGEFNLHNMSFNKRKQVSAAVKGYDRVNASRANLQYVSDNYPKILQLYSSSQMLSNAYKQHCRKILLAIMEDAEAQAKALNEVLSSDKLEMEDKERIDRINKVYEATVSIKRTFLTVANDGITTHRTNARELLNNSQLRKLHK